MANCKQEKILKCQIAIFREVNKVLASRIEKATGVKGYAGISGLASNRTHSGMAKIDELYGAHRSGATKSKGDG